MPPMNLGLPCSKCNEANCLVFMGLKRCSACGVAMYCGTAHQRADRPRHKTSCGIIKEARAALAREEGLLRDHEGGNDMPARPLENPEAIGLFWFWKPTRPFMRAKMDVVTACLNVRTGEAVEDALRHSRELLRLCRSDNLGVRNGMPALYLRLGMDQSAFDFIEWWATRPDDHDFRDPDLPYLDLEGADALAVFEEDHAARWARSLQFGVAMTLLKLRLLIDLTALQAAVTKAPGGRMTVEQKVAFLKEEALSDVLLSRQDVLALPDHTNGVRELERQVRVLYRVVRDRNKHFWGAILDPAPYANAPIGAYGFGTKEEVALAFRDSWYSWAETEAAVQYIRDFISADGGR